MIGPEPTPRKRGQAMLDETVRLPAPKPAKRAKKAKLPRTASPIPCVVLGIDAAATSGWAILEPDGTLDAGELTDACVVVVTRAVERAAALGVPLVAVGEKWSGKWKSIAQVAALGAAWKAWQNELERQKVRRIFRVYTQSWRAVVFGGKRTAEEWKAKAIEHAREKYRLELGDDAAEAVCIAEWGQCAGEVAAKMPKPKKTIGAHREKKPARAEPVVTKHRVAGVVQEVTLPGALLEMSGWPSIPSGIPIALQAEFPWL